MSVCPPLFLGVLGWGGHWATPHYLVLEGVKDVGGELGAEVLAGDEGQQLVSQCHWAQPVGQAQLHHCSEGEGERGQWGWGPPRRTLKPTGGPPPTSCSRPLKSSRSRHPPTPYALQILAAPEVLTPITRPP